MDQQIHVIAPDVSFHIKRQTYSDDLTRLSNLLQQNQQVAHEYALTPDCTIREVFYSNGLLPKQGQRITFGIAPEKVPCFSTAYTNQPKKYELNVQNDFDTPYLRDPKKHTRGSLLVRVGEVVQEQNQEAFTAINFAKDSHLLYLSSAYLPQIGVVRKEFVGSYPNFPEFEQEVVELVCINAVATLLAHQSEKQGTYLSVPHSTQLKFMPTILEQYQNEHHLQEHDYCLECPIPDYPYKPLAFVKAARSHHHHYTFIRAAHPRLENLIGQAFRVENVKQVYPFDQELKSL